MLNNKDHSRLTYFTASLVQSPYLWKSFFAIVEGTHPMTIKLGSNKLSKLEGDFKDVIEEIKKEFELRSDEIDQAKNSRIETKYIVSDIVQSLLKKSTCRADIFSEAGHSLEWWLSEYYPGVKL